MRLLHQQHADLKKLFLTMGQQTGLAVALAVKTQQAQHLIQPIVLFAAHPGAQAGPHRFIPFIAVARFSATVSASKTVGF